MSAFIHNIGVRNVNEALAVGLRILAGPLADTELSRNGDARVLRSPAVTIYREPTERVLFSPVRDANPFFHLMEALWMLAGRDDLSWLVQFNSKFAAYSDDGGKTQPAAYGHRWINYFGYNQLEDIIEELSKRPDSRRAVLTMWDGGAQLVHGDRDEWRGGDLGRALSGSADIPCNTHCYFRVRSDATLDMMVSCRSNDIVWGAYGANAVHFSVLQEYLAARLQLRVGTLYQMSFNYHYYENVVNGTARAYAIAQDCDASNLYVTEKLTPMPMFVDAQRFIDTELPAFMEFAAPTATSALPSFQEPFLASVAVPMVMAWRAHKVRNYPTAESLCGRIQGEDWRVACRQWIERRAKKHREKA